MAGQLSRNAVSQVCFSNVGITVKGNKASRFSFSEVLNY